MHRDRCHTVTNMVTVNEPGSSSHNLSDSKKKSTDKMKTWRMFIQLSKVNTELISNTLITVIIFVILTSNFVECFSKLECLKQIISFAAPIVTNTVLIKLECTQMGKVFQNLSSWPANDESQLDLQLTFNQTALDQKVMDNLNTLTL